LNNNCISSKNNKKWDTKTRWKYLL